MVDVSFKKKSHGVYCITKLYLNSVSDGTRGTHQWFSIDTVYLLFPFLVYSLISLDIIVHFSIYSGVFSSASLFNQITSENSYPHLHVV